MSELEIIKQLIGVADKSKSSLTRVEFVALKEAREYVAKAEKSSRKSKPKAKKPAKKADEVTDG